MGTFEGIMPGGGGTISAFLAYNEARRWSSHKEEFGKGSPEGIAAPEAANNTVACTALVPMLSLGIPSSNSSAVLLGGFLMHGLIPGPMLFVKNPDVVNGLFLGLLIANVAMVIVGYLIMTPCLWLVNRPKPYLMALHLRVRGLRCLRDRGEPLSCRAWRSLFGVIGYAMRYFKVPFLPMVLGVVLGFMVESNYRRALVLSDGDHSTFVQRSHFSGSSRFRGGVHHRLSCCVIVIAKSGARHATTMIGRRNCRGLACQPCRRMIVPGEAVETARRLFIDVAGLCIAARHEAVRRRDAWRG